MNLPIDICRRIKKDFPRTEDRELVEMLLSALRSSERDRVIRCILFAANGDLEKLSQLEELARIDYRDVIMAGEYEYPSNRRLRDLNEPFDS